MTRKKTGPLIAAFIALLLAACQFFGDLASPVEHSKAAFSGRVSSLADSLPVGDVRVGIQGRTAFTDSSGFFSLSDLETGEHALSLSRPGFAPRTITAAVTLRDTLRPFWLISTSPVIDTFYAIPENTRAMDQRVLFFFKAHDSTDSRLNGKIAFDQTDTLPLVYTELGEEAWKEKVFSTAGPHQVELFLWDREKIPVRRGPLTVWVDSNRSPSVLLSQDKPFIVTLCGKIRVVLNDPDSNLQLLQIFWGDNSGDLLDNAPGYASLYSHCYEDTGLYTIQAQVWDNRNASGIGNLGIYVKPLVSPKIDRIDCIPTAYLLSADVTLTPSIFVITANAYVKEIYWSLIADTGKIIEERDSYTDTTGALPTDGRKFEHPFDSLFMHTLPPDWYFIKAYFIDAADSTSIPDTISFEVK